MKKEICSETTEMQKAFVDLEAKNLIHWLREIPGQRKAFSCLDDTTIHVRLDPPVLEIKIVQDNTSCLPSVGSLVAWNSALHEIVDIQFPHASERVDQNAYCIAGNVMKLVNQAREIQQTAERIHDVV